MIRPLITAAVFAVLSVPSAHAINFSGVRCESPEIVSILEENVRDATANGRAVASYGFHTGKISKAVTEHASRDKLVCGITLQLAVAGASQQMRLRYTIRQFSGGKVTATLSER